MIRRAVSTLAEFSGLGAAVLYHGRAARAARRGLPRASWGRRQPGVPLAICVRPGRRRGGVEGRTVAAVIHGRAWSRLAALAVLGAFGVVYATASVGVQVARVVAWRRAAARASHAL